MPPSRRCQCEGGRGPSIWFDEWPRHWDARVMALDPSKGTDARWGDYSAFVMLQLSQDGNLYVDADLEIRNVQVIVEKAVELCRAFSPCAFAVETNQFQELLAVQINEVGTSRGVKMPMYHLANQAPKAVRIRKLTWHLAAGRLRFRRNSPGAQLLVQQLRDFPNGDHDDGPDALEMALRILNRMLNGPSHVGYLVDVSGT